MGYATKAFLLVTLTSQALAAPQLITFGKEGSVGVNFGGYHASAGLGGLLGGGSGGGLFAQAGTPHGQEARAGLGGVMGGAGSAGGLYAGATAGGNVAASAGLAGGTTAQKSAGAGYAAASAGDRFASAGLGGESSGQGSSGFMFSSSKSFGAKNTVEHPVETVEVVKPLNKKVHAEFDFNAGNEVNAVPLVNHNTAARTDVHTEVKVKTKVKPAVYVKEVIEESPPPPVVVEKHYVQPQPIVIEKHIHHAHIKPRRHHYKTAYIGGYVGAPAIEKRVDVGVENEANAGAYVNAGAIANNAGADQVNYTKQVTFQRNPTFFADIFNIPISTLKAVGNFLGNSAAATSVSVQKTSSVQAGAETDALSPKRASESASQSHVSIQTPDASKLIDDIFAIPIDTLSAVNKFLEKNVPARKKVQVSQDGAGEPTRVRLGPHARRRANKEVVVIRETPENIDEIPKDSK